MGDESGFSIVMRGFDSEDSITTIESIVPPQPANEVAPQAVAQAVKDRVGTGDVVVEANESADVAEQEVVEARAAETEAAGSNDEPAAPAKPKKLKKKDYEKQLIERHLDWRDLERKVQRDGLKMVVLVEGRDNGKKGGLVNRIVDFADARICRVARVEPPNGRERTQWFFQPYVAHLPAAGEVVLFDGSWYGRAALERATAKSNDGAFAERLSACAEFESMLIRSGIAIVKCWLSAENEKGAEDLTADLEMLGKRWNVDAKDFEAGLDLARVKEQILAVDAAAPWHVVRGRDKRSVRVDAIRAIVTALADEPKPDVASVPKSGAELRITLDPDDV
jgi:polyphosphate kinase